MILNNLVLNNLVLAAIIIFSVQIFAFIFAYFFKTDKLTDLVYGMTFVIVAWIFLFRQDLLLKNIILVLMISLWGLRLSTYLFIRILKIKKDNRFNKIRKSFIKFFGFWILQGFTISFVMVNSIILLSKPGNNLTIISYLGLAVWLIGLLFETIADVQKFRFKNKNPNKFIKTGLYKYSRHPNYFGEISVWWGIFIFSLPFLENLEYLGIISPFYISFLILFVSGIPILEKRNEEKYGKEYLDYKKKTSALIPLPIKK
jgi:steroid 5-alpha reductase family enzyme